jgi:hypothetical protein
MKEYFMFNSTLIIEGGLAFVDEHGYDIAAWVFCAIFLFIGLVFTLLNALKLFKLDHPGGLCFVFGPFALGCSYLWFAEKELVMQITEHTEVNMIFPALLLFMWYLTVVWTGKMSHRAQRRDLIDWGVLFLLKMACVVLYIGGMCQTSGKYGSFTLSICIIACCLCKLYASTSRTIVARVAENVIAGATSILGTAPLPVARSHSVIISQAEKDSIKWWGVSAVGFTLLYMCVLLLSHAYIGLLSPAGLVIFTGILYMVSLVYMLFIFTTNTVSQDLVSADGDKVNFN